MPPAGVVKMPPFSPPVKRGFADPVARFDDRAGPAGISLSLEDDSPPVQLK